MMWNNIRICAKTTMLFLLLEFSFSEPEKRDRIECCCCQLTGIIGGAINSPPAYNK